MIKKSIFLLEITLAFTVFQSCLAGKPATPGLCSVSCKDAVFASPYAKIEPLDKEMSDIEVQCSADFGNESSMDMDRAVTIRFKVYEPAPNTNSPDTTNSPRSKHQNFDEPRPGITFEPEILSGILSPTRSSTENVSEVTDEETNKTEYFPSRYIGIVTPKSQWCTDSCGTASIEIWPVCVKGSENQVIFSAHSGAKAMETPITYTFTNDDTADTSTTSTTSF